MCSAIAFPTSTNCSGTSITILGIAPPAFWTTFDSLFYQIFEDLSRMRATPVLYQFLLADSSATSMVSQFGAYSLQLSQFLFRAHFICRMDAPIVVALS